MAGALAPVLWGGLGWAAGKPEPPPELIPVRLEHIRFSSGLLATLGVVAFIGVSSVALMLLAAARSPERVARAEAALRRGRWVTVLVGVVSVVVLLLAATVVGKGLAGAAPGLAVLLGLALLAFLVWLGAHGLAGMARIIGRRLLRDDRGDQSPWRTVGAGGLVVAGTLFLPILGPLFFLYLFCRGVGAATLTLFSGESSVSGPPAEAPPGPAPRDSA